MNTAIKNHYKTIMSFAVMILFTNLIYAQQISFTQYMDNLTPLNPAFSLMQPGGSVFSSVRKQWIGVPGSPTDYLVNASIPVEPIGGSVGLIATNDVFAIENQTEVNAFFAKGIRISKTQTLAVSINAGLRYYNANYESVDAGDQVFQNNVRQTSPNIGFGVMFFSDSYYVGVSVPELNIRNLGNASQQTTIDDQNHYYFTAGLSTVFNDDFKLKYSGLVSYSQGVPVIADVSTILYLQQTIGIGVNYRTNNEAAGIFSIQYKNIHLGYSYQFGTTSSNIAGFSNATQEFLVGISFGKGGKTNEQ
jgi:type IX secretion system PorP/SprF family membrane protein